MARVDSFCCNYDVVLVWPFRKPAPVQGSLRFRTRDSLTLSKIKSAACWQKKITVPIHAFGLQTCKIERVQIRNCTPYGGHLMIVVMIVCKCTSMRCCSGIDRETQPRACSHSDNWSVESILRMETCCQPLDVEMSRNFSTVIVGCWNSGIVPSNIGIGIVKNVHAISFLYRRWNLKGTGHLQKHTKTIWKNRRFNFRRVVCRIVGRPLGTSFKFCMEGVGLAQAESIVGRGNVYVAKWRHNCNANLCTERFVRVEICRENFENAYMGKLYGNFACIVFRLAFENL